jgi:membrane protein YdbS with pleckstrin-like domain
MISMPEPFSNEPIAVGDLPQLDPGVFVSVDPRFVWGQLAGLGGAASVVVGVGALIVWRSGDLFWPALVVGGIIVVIVTVAVGAILEARRLAYQLRDHDLSLRSGVIRHRVETIPYSRVQHVSVGRGVIERALGLATLELSSAGPDIAVPGLSVEDAERIKQVVAERAGVDDEPVTEGPTNEWAPPSPGPPALGSPS